MVLSICTHPALDWCAACAFPMSVADPGKKRIISAGKAISDPSTSQADRESAIEVIGNWRARHIFPLGIVSTDLQLKCSQIPRTVIAQRLKRLESIEYKLFRRDSLHSMNLWTMQDIGGCRAILPTLKDVHVIDALYGEGSFLPHRRKDYIASPKTSGYRGIHLIVKYQDVEASEYNGIQIEIQLRSRLQHIWATAVETVGSFTKQSLKASAGSDRWLRFFALIGALIAMKEQCTPVPDTPKSMSELIAALRPMAVEVRQEIMAFTHTVRHAEDFRKHPESEYYLLTINEAEMSWGVRGYRRERLEEANRDYSLAEAEGLNAVLVSTRSLESLWEAYPNYRLDLGNFRRLVNAISLGHGEESNFDFDFFGAYMR